MGVLHPGIGPGPVALHDKALLLGSFIFCRAEGTMCCPGADRVCTERCSKHGERVVLWAQPQLEVRLQPQSWSGERLEAPACTREGVKAAMRRDSQI